jgi:hypothetical protein
MRRITPALIALALGIMTMALAGGAVGAEPPTRADTTPTRPAPTSVEPVPGEGVLPVPVDELEPADPTLPEAPADLRFIAAGVALEDADDDGFVMLASRLNRPMAAALAAERKVFVHLDQDTQIVSRTGAREEAEDIEEGDRVVVAWTAAAGTLAPGLPTAELVVDLGPAPRFRSKLAVIGGIALADATSRGFPALVKRANRAARKLIPRRHVRVLFDRDTKIVIANRRYGRPAEIDKGDRVIVVWRIPRHAGDPSLPAADLVVVLGPARRH